MKAWFTLTLGEMQDRWQPGVTKVIALQFNLRYYLFRAIFVLFNVFNNISELTRLLFREKTTLVVEKLAIRLLFIDQEYVDIKKNKCMIIMYAYIAISMQNIFWYSLHVINHPRLLSSALFMLNHANAFTYIADKINGIATTLVLTTMLVL